MMYDENFKSTINVQTFKDEVSKEPARLTNCFTAIWQIFQYDMDDFHDTTEEDLR